MPLSSDRNTRERDGEDYGYAPAAGQTIFRGAIVCLNASNELVRGSAALNLRCVGVAQNSTLDTSFVGHIVARRRRSFQLRNSAASDAITLGAVGSQCFISDDDQVALTNGGGTRSVCGIVRHVDAAGVWVEI